jgi:hypothetical protein
MLFVDLSTLLFGDLSTLVFRHLLYSAARGFPEIWAKFSREEMCHVSVLLDGEGFVCLDMMEAVSCSVLEHQQLSQR